MTVTEEYSGHVEKPGRAHRGHDVTGDDDRRGPASA